MSAPPYMKLYIADYHGDTTHLTALEHGVYLLLVMAMWRGGGKLPADDAKLSRVAKVTAREWASLKPTILAFFKRRGGVLTHKRVTRELAHYETVSEKRREASNKGVSEKRNKNSVKSLPIGSHESNQLVTKPEPEPESSLEPTRGSKSTRRASPKARQDGAFVTPFEAEDLTAMDRLVQFLARQDGESTLAPTEL